MNQQQDQVRVLYIEPDHNVAHHTQQCLAQQNIVLDIVPTSHKGFSFLEQSDYDLVMLEYLLPDSNAEQLLRDLRSQEHKLPVLFVTHYNDVAAAVSAINAGAQDYVVKDDKHTYLTKLPTAIRQAIATFKTQQQQEASQQTDDLIALKKRNRYLTKLNKASQNLTATLDTQKVMTQIMVAATGITDAKDASLWIWEDDRREHLVCHATSNLELFEALRKHRLSPGQGIVGWVAQHGSGTVSNNVANDPRFTSKLDQATGFNTESLLAVPLLLRGDLLGVLELVNKKNSAFEEEDMSVAVTLATSASIGLDNARLVERLRQQTSELQERNQELDTFAHTVAHDLKTPLIWISGYADLLAREDSATSVEEQRTFARSIVDGATKMEQIIEELLLLASLREASIVISKINMQDVVTEACVRLEHMIDQYKGELTIAPDMPAVFGYPPWIEGVWANYISNALKYGGQPPKIEIGYEDRDDDMVWFYVQDNGAGIKPEEHEKLFLPFSRLEAITSQRGHGVGLSIVRHILEKLDGKVGLESAPGEGSRFMFALPKQHPAEKFNSE